MVASKVEGGYDMKRVLGEGRSCYLDRKFMNLVRRVR